VAESKYLGMIVTNKIIFTNQFAANQIHGTVSTIQFRSFVFPYATVYKHVKIKMYRTIILPVLLYGHKSWPVSLMEE
jgi:hypothetical protein